MNTHDGGAAFTPGPWTERKQKSTDGRDLGWIIEFSNGRIGWASLAYADTNEEASADDPAREANARLIAAAPDLLEELRIAVGVIREICSVRDIPLPHSTIRRIEAAIRRATGVMG